ncbi:MAG: galactokinase, partial [Acidobacteria bacterium]|nr:galactokinase [Acidobacteriota bacterium]
MADLDSVVQSYRSRFGVNPRVLSRAPGRVNLIGEHTDYNEGWVLPFAIARSLHVAAGPGDSPGIVVHSCTIGESVQFDLEVSIPAESHTWQNYVRGVVVGLRRAGVDLPPSKLCIGCDLPSGTGLSSSAALCVAASLALLELSDARMDPLSLARIAQAAEREFA